MNDTVLSYEGTKPAKMQSRRRDRKQNIDVVRSKKISSTERTKPQARVYNTPRWEPGTGTHHTNFPPLHYQYYLIIYLFNSLFFLY